MPIPRLRIDNTAVLVIDVQERLLPTIAARQRVEHNCAVLLQLAGTLGLPAIVTEQYPRGLGHTAEAVRRAMAESCALIEKTRFSALVDDVTSRLQQWQRSTVLIGGLEAQVCVLQSVLDLQAGGRQCFLASDAISAGQVDQVAPAFERMRQAGAIVTGVLSAMYELMGDSRHEGFRACLELAKMVKSGDPGSPNAERDPYKGGVNPPVELS